MGYTHYWTMKRTAPPTVFAAVVDDVQALVKRFEADGGALSESDGPEITADVIRFNGKEPDDYETFVLKPRASDFEFCKTQFLPYDALVCATLIAAKHHLGDDISVRSDGEWAEWEPGVSLYRATFPDRSPQTIFDSDDED